MALIPTTREIADQNLAGFEAPLAQVAPLNDRSFLRILSVVEAMAMTGLYKFAAERIRQTLAQYATGEDLDALGIEVNTPRKPAEYASVTVTLPALDDIIIPITSSFIGTANGVRYNMTAEGLSVDGTATLQLTAEVEGVVGNLTVDDTLTIVSQVAGAGTTATVTAVTNTGTEPESDEDYRPRVLFAQYSTTGGSNATDHKVWAEAIAGVQRAFPYAGRPSGTSYPGDRTVYIESDTTINPDGVPTVGLLAEVRAAINAVAGLGHTDETLWIEPITRTSVTVTVTNLVAVDEATVRTAIEDALTPYMLRFAPYIEGVDLPQERNDVITVPAVAQTVQEVLTVHGAKASSVSLNVGNSYTLDPGELVKLAAVVYATV